jgi:hypothetical protein
MVRKMNSSAAHFHAAIMNADVRVGFVGNFTPKETKEYLLFSRDRRWMKEHHALSSTDMRFSRALHTTGFAGIHEYTLLHSFFISLSIYFLLPRSFNIFLALLDLWFS